MNKYLCIQCSHPFSHPLALTNNSGNSSETYYACPYCLSKIDVDESDLVAAFREEMKTGGFMTSSPEAPELPKLPKLPKLPEEEAAWKNIVIPDECLDCHNLLPCVHTLITLMESRKGNADRQSSVCKFL